MLYRQDRFEEALELYTRALAIAEAPGGQEEPDPARAAVLRTSIAGLYKEMGQYQKSRPIYEKALEGQVQLLGRQHYHVAVSMTNLADLYMHMTQPELALPLYVSANAKHGAKILLNACPFLL